MLQASCIDSVCGDYIMNYVCSENNVGLGSIEFDMVMKVIIVTLQQLSII